MPNRLPCHMVTLDRVYELCFRLARGIRESGFAPDLMVAVARGGFVPARLLCDFLQHRDLTSLSVVHYAASGRWILYQWALVEDVGSFVKRMEPEPRTYEDAARRLEKEFELVLDRDLWEKVSPALSQGHGRVG